MFTHIIGMRREQSFEQLKPIDEKETFVNNFSKKEDKNEDF